MSQRTANVGVVGLAVADRIEDGAREILNHNGGTPAALVVIGYNMFVVMSTSRKTCGSLLPSGR